MATVVDSTNLDNKLLERSRNEDKPYRLRFRSLGKDKNFEETFWSSCELSGKCTELWWSIYLEPSISELSKSKNKIFVLF